MGIKMNQRMLILERLRNYNKLDTDAFRPKVNALEIDINNSPQHEMAKFLCVWLIRKGVPADILPKIFRYNEDFEEETYGDPIGSILEISSDIPMIVKKYGVKIKEKWRVPEVVTEARFRDKFERCDEHHKNGTYTAKARNRRADIFILDTGEIIEIETNHKIQKKDSITIYV